MAHPVEQQLVEQVELQIACKGLKNMDILSLSDPCVQLSLGYPQPNRSIMWKPLGKTEVIMNNLNPSFAKTFVLDYRFEEVQHLKFDIYDIDNQTSTLDDDDWIGEVITTLAEICGSRGQKLIKPVMNRGRRYGMIIVSAEQKTKNMDDLRLQISGYKIAKMDFFGLTDAYFVINKVASNDEFLPTVKSDVIHSNLNPNWKEFTVSLSKLCNGDIHRTLRFDCFDWNKYTKHSFIGSFRFTVNDLLTGKKRFELLSAKQKSMGHITFNIATLLKKYQFLEYIGGGLEMNLVVAVDWTASNRHPSRQDSLHYNAPNFMNEYECAIRAIGDILSYYDADKQYPTFGFGGKLPNNVVSHCFALNGNPQQPDCQGVDGILAAYKQALLNVELYGPTHFSPVLQTLRHMAGSVDPHSQKYFVLLLLTDGVINDMDATLSTIVDLSSLPVSIVIVGVGDADFTAMDILDSDDRRLFDGRRYAERDIVQFVPFRTLRNQPYSVLAKETLAEIPLQVTEYFAKRNITPKPRPLVQIPSFYGDPNPDVPDYNPNAQTSQNVPLNQNNFSPPQQGVPPQNSIYPLSQNNQGVAQPSFVHNANSMLSQARIAHNFLHPNMPQNMNQPNVATPSFQQQAPPQQGSFYQVPPQNVQQPQIAPSFQQGFPPQQGSVYQPPQQPQPPRQPQNSNYPSNQI